MPKDKKKKKIRRLKPKVLGTGGAAQAGKKLETRKERLERFEKQLFGKTF